MNFKTIVATTAVAASLALTANPASADGKLRGDMTAVNNVASAMADRDGYANSRWLQSKATPGKAVNKTDAPSANAYKWADAQADKAAKSSANVEQSRTRWALRNDSEQARTRWALRNDAAQSRTRWALRGDVSQARTRWALRNDTVQARTRWALRNDAGQARTRWALRNDGTQARTRWALR